ncbi:MAG TPA: hypothetical protein VMW66_05960 [Elusimicrobiales bacterium]|nr:hypothetical protein [Elusimicrobiales bacterium]
MTQTEATIEFCRKALDKGRGGNVQAAIKAAEKMKVKELRYCVGCEVENPSIAKYCCVCGSKNK